MAAVAAIGLGACGGATPAQSDPVPTLPSPTPEETLAAVPSGVSIAPTGAAEEFDDGTTGAPLAPSTLKLDEESRSSALKLGEKVMRLFARRDVSAEQWFAELAPHLTPDAAMAHQYTDPQNVPVTRVDGPPTLTPASTELVARVAVPTDIGIYLVILTRTDELPSWLANEIIPPEDVGP